MPSGVYPDFKDKKKTIPHPAKGLLKNKYLSTGEPRPARASRAKDPNRFKDTSNKQVRGGKDRERAVRKNAGKSEALTGSFTTDTTQDTEGHYPTIKKGSSQAHATMPDHWNGTYDPYVEGRDPKSSKYLTGMGRREQLDKVYKKPTIGISNIDTGKDAKDYASHTEPIGNSVRTSFADSFFADINHMGDIVSKKAEATSGLHPIHQKSYDFMGEINDSLGNDYHGPAMRAERHSGRRDADTYDARKSNLYQMEYGKDSKKRLGGKDFKNEGAYRGNQGVIVSKADRKLRDKVGIIPKINIDELNVAGKYEHNPQGGPAIKITERGLLGHYDMDHFSNRDSRVIESDKRTVGIKNRLVEGSTAFDKTATSEAELYGGKMKAMDYPLQPKVYPREYGYRSPLDPRPETQFDERLVSGKGYSDKERKDNRTKKKITDLDFPLATERKHLPKYGKYMWDEDNTIPNHPFNAKNYNNADKYKQAPPPVKKAEPAKKKAVKKIKFNVKKKPATKITPSARTYTRGYLSGHALEGGMKKNEFSTEKEAFAMANTHREKVGGVVKYTKANGNTVYALRKGKVLKKTPAGKDEASYQF